MVLVIEVNCITIKTKSIKSVLSVWRHNGVMGLSHWPDCPPQCYHIGHNVNTINQYGSSY